MTGKKLFIGFMIFVLIFGAGLFYTINYFYYDARQYERMKLMTSIGEIELTNSHELNASTTPLKMRICADKIDLSGFDETGRPTPLVAPFWFKCFDAGALSQAIEEGRAEARIIRFNSPWGFDLYAVNYNERVHIWRQLNECGETKFSGDPVPDLCPPENE